MGSLSLVQPGFAEQRNKGRYRTDAQLGNLGWSASDWFSSIGSLTTGGRSWRVRASSLPARPGNEQPQACANLLTPQTSHTDPPACVSSRSQSSETAATSNGESTTVGNPKQAGLFSPPQLYKSTIWGNWYYNSWGVRTIQMKYSKQSAAYVRLLSRKGRGLSHGGVKRGPWMRTIQGLILVLHKEWWNPYFTMTRCKVWTEKWGNEGK